MTDEIAQGLDVIQRPPVNRRQNLGQADETAADGCARWIAEFGDVHGFRPPNAQERARMIGMGEYAQALNLTEVELYDATGNAFITFEISQRLTPIVDHLAGDANLTRHRFHSPATLLLRYQALYSSIVAPTGA